MANSEAIKKRGNRLNLKPISVALVLLGPILSSAEAPRNVVTAPPNAPAEVKILGPKIEISYHGQKILRAEIENPNALLRAAVNSSKAGDAVHQVVILNAKSWEEPIVLAGLIGGSDESFACESDRNPRGPAVVRHSSGPSRSLLNQAVYDRKWDWVLSVDDQPRTRTVVRPETSGGEGNMFALKSRGYEIVLRFRPRFYQAHRGLRHYEPWTYRPWDKPVVGWCSWFAYYDKITEQDMLHAADVIAEVLAPFGYEYVQMDDGYQRDSGTPELWLRPNEKFPRGLEHLASYIKGKGLRPGIWTNVAFNPTEFAEEHKEWFVLDDEGRLARGNWVRHIIDASAPGALDALVRPVYRGLSRMGWEYLKVDALRHLRYEGYNTFSAHFRKKRVDLVQSYRKLVEAIRDEIGRDRFMLGCWGVRPELAGLIDGCRLGTDGFSYAGLAQYNSFNNVVWRNDPDHIELSPAEAYRSTMVTSLTGSLLLLTDRPEVYHTAIVEPAKRSAPVLFTLPGQIYDVDPSRSQSLWRVDVEVSGKEPKAFDAGLVPACHLYLLEISRPFEDWMVLGRTGGDFPSIRFENLGLDAAQEYYVFDFWGKKLLGSFSEYFQPGEIDPKFNCQVFCIRKRQPHPQVLATTRHITGGGVDLLDVKWENSRLSGRSRIVAGDVYQVLVSVPPGFAVEKADCRGAAVVEMRTEGAVVCLSLKAEQTGEISWAIAFEDH
jgi:alpha-galactosidase